MRDGIMNGNNLGSKGGWGKRYKRQGEGRQQRLRGVCGEDIVQGWVVFISDS